MFDADELLALNILHLYLGDDLRNLLDKRHGLFPHDLDFPHLGDFDRPLLDEDLRDLHDPVHHPRRILGHVLENHLSARVTHLLHAIHSLHCRHLNRTFLLQYRRDLLDFLLWLYDYLRDGLRDLLPTVPGHLSYRFDGLHHGYLHWRLFPQQHWHVDRLIDVSVLWHEDLFVDVADHWLWHLPYHLPDLDLRHLYDLLLVDDVWHLNSSLDVLDDSLGHHPVDDLHLDLGHLLHDVPHLDLGHLDDALLNLDVLHLLKSRDEVVFHFVHVLGDLLHVGPKHLPDDLLPLGHGNVDDSLVHEDLRHLHLTLAKLHHHLLDRLWHSLFECPGDLLHESDGLRMGHLHEVLVNQIVGDLHEPRAWIWHWPEHLFHDVPVLNMRNLTDHLVDLRLRHFLEGLMHESVHHLFGPLKRVNLWHLDESRDLLVVDGLPQHRALYGQGCPFHCTGACHGAIGVWFIEHIVRPTYGTQPFYGRRLKWPCHCSQPIPRK
mmetsp:Transcript_32337/g.89354  ORF Transcript_32337/g.89354 Transcript_32337/m.89354 type:complete len:490 (-) Transcript_32337:29-1498(-)